MKKGFTLIELLAVVVILAIIAVIAVPIVLDVINDTKTSTSERKSGFYLDAVDNAIMQYKLKENKKYIPSECLIDADGNLWCDELTVKIEVEVDGEKPDGGTIVFEQGKIVSSELTYSTEVIRNNEKGESVKVENLATLANYSTVYFDVSTGKSCKASYYHSSNSETGYNGIDNKSESQNGCLKFYVLSTNSDTATLILDHNTTATVVWNSNRDNTTPNEILTQLNADTSNWQGTLTPAGYDGYKARLITAYEIQTITGHTNWEETTKENSHFFFDTKTLNQSETCKQGNTSGCKYGWLYDRTSEVCKATGCLNNSSQSTAGYWTATTKTVASDSLGHKNLCDGKVVYGVSYVGRLGFACPNQTGHYGVRPVIIVSKNSL